MLSSLLYSTSDYKTLKSVLIPTEASLFAQSCSAPSKIPHWEKSEGPTHQGGNPACSSNAMQENANLPSFTYLSPVCGEAC